MMNNTFSDAHHHSRMGGQPRSNMSMYSMYKGTHSQKSNKSMSTNKRKKARKHYMLLD